MNTRSNPSDLTTDPDVFAMHGATYLEGDELLRHYLADPTHEADMLAAMEIFPDLTLGCDFNGELCIQLTEEGLYATPIHYAFYSKGLGGRETLTPFVGWKTFLHYEVMAHGWDAGYDEIQDVATTLRGGLTQACVEVRVWEKREELDRQLEYFAEANQCPACQGIGSVHGRGGGFLDEGCRKCDGTGWRPEAAEKLKAFTDNADKKIEEITS